MQLTNVISLAKEKQGFTSDRALAAAMGVSDVAVLRWRRHESVPKSTHAYQIAILAEIEPDIFVAAMLEMGADCRSTKRLFQRIKETLAAAAGVIPALGAAIIHQGIMLQQCILCKIGKESTAANITHLGDDIPK